MEPKPLKNCNNRHFTGYMVQGSGYRGQSNVRLGGLILVMLVLNFVIVLGFFLWNIVSESRIMDHESWFRNR